MEKTISIKGTGELYLRPNTYRMAFDINGLCKTYLIAYNEMTAITDEVKKNLCNKGVERKDIITENIDIRRSEKDKLVKDKWVKQFLGYEYHHNMKLDIPIDNKLLSSLIEVLHHACKSPDIKITYLKKGTEEDETYLMRKMVEDARSKANIILETAGCRLGELLSVDYKTHGSDEFFGEDLPILDPNTEYCIDAQPLDIETDDIHISRSAHFIWEIKQ